MRRPHEAKLNSGILGALSDLAPDGNILGTEFFAQFAEHDGGGNPRPTRPCEGVRPVAPSDRG